MKIYLIGALLFSTSLFAADITCLSNPRIKYSGNAGLGTTTDFAKKADEYFDKIKKDKDIVNNCSIYAGIKQDILRIYNKALDYRRDGDVSGLSNRSIRARAARCLKSMHSKMIYMGKDHVNYIGTTMEAGTNQDYNVTSLFKYDQFCDAPQTSNNNPGPSSGLVAIPGTSRGRGIINPGGRISTIPGTTRDIPGGNTRVIPGKDKGGRSNPGGSINTVPGDTTTDKPNIGGKPRVVKSVALECPQSVQVIPPQSPKAKQAKPTFSFLKIKEISLKNGKFNYVCNYKYAPSRNGINWYMSGIKSEKCRISGNKLYCQ